jgi:hypothetical protein
MKGLRHLWPDPLLTICLVLALCTLFYSDTLAANRVAQQTARIPAAAMSGYHQAGSEPQNNDSKTQEG